MKLLFSIVMLAVGLWCTAQKIDSSTIEVKYIAEFLIDTANIGTKQKELTYLRIGRNSSLFKSDRKDYADSATSAAVQKSIENPIDGRVIINTKDFVNAKFVPEVSFTKDKMIVYDMIQRAYYNFVIDEKIQWNLINETRIIDGYSCKKAIGKYRNKEFTAWYTSEIPISEGPYTLKGLPGLILEAYDSKEYFHFTLASLQYVKKPIQPIGGASMNTEYNRFIKKENRSWMIR